MNAKEIEGIITRIVKDFSHLMPGLSVQFMKTKAYRARVAGRTAQPGPGSQDIMPPLYPLQSEPKTNRLLICTEEVNALLAREAPELRTATVEGLILNEILFLAVSRSGEPDPRAKAEEILCRYWPLQYATIFGRKLLSPNSSE